MDDPEPARRALQPRISSAVYQDSENDRPAEIGQVAQVIIDPCSRLVSSVVVRVSGGNNESEESLERLVPMAAVKAVNESHVWLKEGEQVDRYPSFDRKTFPLPPANWRPPFPYLPGMVRWSIPIE